ncbi:hypothetical protein PACTADRAFT_51812 [Pachysolen tannophilus NRRL Y-2460]|uniref:Uncharacterized protein n=1 Tax=Pachysolen tannophilus NRRL Y-2460 TaxID=669874 RepID=A0A1E4TN46_PACTA|nr:hypothetical protein PACTADRAFT_51812 [Pachysolen tannophilus NRRL Y-2460]
MSYGTKAAERLANKIILITGASAGIGRATALEYAAAANGNIKLILVARRLQNLQKLQNDLQSTYKNLKSHISVLDVSKIETIKPFLSNLPSEFQKIDILVNNAGKAIGKAQVGDIEQEDINDMFDTNVKGMIALTQEIVKDFKKRNADDIVQLGSIAGRDAYPGGAIYCATKFALKAFTESLRKELINTNIRVIEVAPGAVETEFSIVRNYGDVEKAKQVYDGRIPLTAEDIAEVIVFATTRRSNTVIAETVIFPTDQASASHNYIRKN